MLFSFFLGSKSFPSDTVEGSEIPFPTTWNGAKTLYKMEWAKLPTATGARGISGCHQQYGSDEQSHASCISSFPSRLEAQNFSKIISIVRQGS